MTGRTPKSVLDGTLLRDADGWYWCDGRREPKVGDIDANLYYDFRCRTTGNGTYVEVPRSRAENEPDLDWVIDGLGVDKFRVAASGDHSGPRTLEATAGKPRIRRTAIRPRRQPPQRKRPSRRSTDTPGSARAHQGMDNLGKRSRSDRSAVRPVRRRRDTPPRKRTRMEMSAWTVVLPHE